MPTSAREILFSIVGGFFRGANSECWLHYFVCETLNGLGFVMMACNEEKLIIARHFATKTAYKYCIGSAYDLKFNLRAGILDQMTTLLRQHHDYCQLTFLKIWVVLPTTQKYQILRKLIK